MTNVENICDMTDEQILSKSNDEISQILDKMYDAKDRRYSRLLRRWVVEGCAAVDREIEKKGPLEALADDDAAIADLF